jgi:transcription antitermination factor NusG
VAVCQSRGEIDVVLRATQAGMVCWLAQKRDRVVKRGRRTYEINPVWPGYFFARAEHRLNELRNMRGVFGLLKNEDGFPALVRDSTIQAHKARCDRNGIYQTEKIETKFEIGERVRPMSGAFSDLVGLFVSSKDFIETASFDFLGSQRELSFEQGRLVAA